MAESTLSVTVVGGPTAILEVGGVRMLIDPTFSAPGAHETAPGRTLTKTEGPAVRVEDVGPIDVVLLSHDQHADNLDPAGREVVAAAPLTLSTESAANRLPGNVHALSSWDHVVLPRPDGGEVEITAVPARHGPVGCEPVTGEVTGFVVRGDDLPVVYVSGDNAALEIVSEIARRLGPIDVALLFAGAARTSLFDGAPLTLTSADAAEATRAMGAPVVVPLHVRGWSHFTEGPDRIREAFASAGLTDRLRIVEPGETLRL